MVNFKRTVLLFLMVTQIIFAQEDNVRVLNFYGDNGFQHASKTEAVNLIEELGRNNQWDFLSTDSSTVFNSKNLSKYNVVIFNNNCGNNGRILSIEEQQAFQQYVRNGGGFVGIHCAGAIWKEEGQFQQWYESLLGSRMVDHPAVQQATLIVENKSHPITSHLDSPWIIKDEWHRFANNPRERVNVLLSLDEASYEGEQKMGGDHPFTWYQYFDGGRSFFTSLGHTPEIYGNTDYQQMLQKAIVWAAGLSEPYKDLPIKDGLLLDLNADHGVEIEDGNKIVSWRNKVHGNDVGTFVKQDKGRRPIGSGRPRLVLNVPELNGHNTVVFHRQELVNENEDAFDHLTTGGGYTWFSVMSVYEQIPDLPGVNSFFGNLRNTNLDEQGKYEGLWAGFTDDNRVWTGARNGVTFGRWDKNNPQILSPEPLEKNKFYLVMGRMDAGTGNVKTELFINDIVPLTEGLFPVSSEVNPSKMVIGQERDATNHPGRESFDGEISRFLIYDRKLSDEELKLVRDYLVGKYNLD
jgi:type 1 glutamine amidotransferase